MSSSPLFNLSSPFSQSADRSGRRKSRFTFKNLSQLGLSSPTCPLRVVAHIDLDAFYAQCEMIRLGVAEDQPLAVQQWQGLIAINYPAREYGLSRHVTITEAKKACPNIVLQHVATWKEGEEMWGYHDDAFENIGTHKVSLDPYRLQSRRILALIKELLPAPPAQRVEKASVDEVFLDLSTQVHDILLERYPELQGPAPYDDPSESLPSPPTTALDWCADALVDLDASETEEEAPDWDDIAILVGSEIVRSIRASIRERLKYTCSAGLARNKMLAKLGSGHKKPNSQTVVRNRAIEHFLSEFKFTKIRNLGGKLGDEVVSTFNTDLLKELLEVPLEQLKKLGDDTGMWLYQTIRGEDHSEVNSRTQIKSMLSAKSFRPSINSFEQGVKWLRIFVADIFARLVEEGVLENKRRPKTVNLHHRQGQQTRSKQSPIPQGKTLNEDILFDLAKNLLAQVIVDGRAWPCSNLSLSVGGFEDGITGNHGIGGFLVKGDEAKSLQETARAENSSSEPISAPPEKKRRIDDGHINKFFTTTATQVYHKDAAEPADFDELPSAQQQISGGDIVTSTGVDDEGTEAQAEYAHSHEEGMPEGSSSSPVQEPDAEADKVRPASAHSSTIEKFLCDRCQRYIAKEQEEEHNDWHFARDIQNEEQSIPGMISAAPAQSNGRSAKPPTQHKASRGRGRPAGRGSGSVRGIEKGQSRLGFGR
ncbi:MAG: DNA-directed DNA polymerase eta rad30 [Alyxoria varia]|nr:MAG: DNA-directed DNA polymerase eta rad30 [Alyxoria varia]